MIGTRLIRLLSLTLLCSLAGQVLAQAALPAARTGGRDGGLGAYLPSTATFKLGMTTDSGATYVDNARVADTVQIRGEITPEAGNLNELGKIYVVDWVNRSTFLNWTGSAWISWNGVVAQLVPVQENVPLTSPVSVNLFSGTLGTAADHYLFMGYRAPDGILRYHNIALPLTITADQTPLEQATDLFSSKISPNIVQAACVACHTSGGSAAGLSTHTFVLDNNSNHLTINFEQFRNLRNTRGSALILSKVKGGDGHVGGAQLSGTSQEYRDLEDFLTLLSQL